MSVGLLTLGLALGQSLSVSVSVSLSCLCLCLCLSLSCGHWRVRFSVALFYQYWLCSISTAFVLSVLVARAGGGAAALWHMARHA